MDEESKYAVSIIIPHFNTPDLLAKLLSTIPKMEEIQTIIVDDHSSKEVKEQLKELEAQYADSNMLFLNNDTPEHNAGTARNIGLDHAEGKWLFFADADDYFADGCYDAIKKYLDSDYDIVFFAPSSIQLDTGKEDMRNQNYLQLINDYLQKPCGKTESSLKYSWLAPWSKLFRHSTVKSNGIRFTSVLHSNDTMFSVMIGFYAEKITASTETIYFVTRHVGSLTTDLSEEAFDMRTGERIRAFQFLKENLSEKDMKNTGICHFPYSCLLTILQRKYGMDCFISYLRLFIKNRMFYFKIDMFSSVKFLHVIRRIVHHLANERNIKTRYEPNS